MNTALLLQPMFDMLKWLLPLMLFMSILKTRLFKGWFGELLVRLSTHLLLDHRTYQRLHDVTLHTPDGTTQIDLKLRNDPTAARLCPRCGNALVVRTYKSGNKAGQQFWGCSTYPKCRTMQSIAANC